MADLCVFVGKWQEETKEGFDEMAKALGLPEDKAEMYKATRTAISYKMEGDAWEIDVGMVGAPAGMNFHFTLGEFYQSADLDGTPMKSLIRADGCSLIEEHVFEDGRLKGAQMNINRWIENDMMMVKTTMCGHSILSKYKKL